MVNIISRCGGLVFGVDTETNVAELPKTPDEMEAISGRKEEIPAWSLALIGNGKIYWFTGSVWFLFGEA